MKECVCISVYLSVCFSVSVDRLYLSVFVFVCPSVILRSVYICLLTYIFIYLSIYTCVCLYLSIHLSIHLSSLSIVFYSLISYFNFHLNHSFYLFFLCRISLFIILFSFHLHNFLLIFFFHFALQYNNGLYFFLFSYFILLHSFSYSLLSYNVK